VVKKSALIMISSIVGFIERRLCCAIICVLHTGHSTTIVRPGNKCRIFSPLKILTEKEGKVADSQLRNPIPPPVLTGSGSKGLLH
jgi:hypothetical protein